MIAINFFNNCRGSLSVLNMLRRVDAPDITTWLQLQILKGVSSVIEFKMKIVWYLGDSCIKVHWSSGSNFVKIQSFRSKKSVIENNMGSYGKMHLL